MARRRSRRWPGGEPEGVEAGPWGVSVSAGNAFQMTLWADFGTDRHTRTTLAPLGYESSAEGLS
jgi:hypothetical protein